MAIFHSKSDLPHLWGPPETQVAALQKLDRIPAAFEVWCYGRREDAEARGVVTKNSTPVPQPARLLPRLPLFLGDLDDAKDVDNLKWLED